MWPDQVLQQSLQLCQVLDQEQPVVGVVHLVERDQGLGYSPQGSLNQVQTASLFNTKLVSSLQHPNFHGNFYQVFSCFLRILLVIGLEAKYDVIRNLTPDQPTHMCMQQEEQVVKQTSSAVLNQIHSNKFVAEELVGEAFLDFIGH